MARAKKVTVAQVEPLIESTNGNIAAIGRQLGVSRTTVRKRINESSILQEKLDDARQGMIDNAESSLYRAVLNGESWAVCFFLKTQGKGRGYTERQEISGPEAGPVSVETFNATLKRVYGEDES